MNAIALLGLLALSLPEPGGAPPDFHGGSARAAIVAGGVAISARVAWAEDARYRGLTGVESLEDGEGMLFLYPHARPMRFWMAGCLIPLDIAFLDTDLRILSVKTCRPPRPGAPDGEIERAPSPGAVRYVLEMGGGFFDRHGIGPGAQVQLPPSILLLRAE